MTHEAIAHFLKRRELKRTWIIIALTGFVLAVVVFFTSYLHDANNKEMVSQLQDHQFLHAQNIAEHIESFLTGH